MSKKETQNIEARLINLETNYISLVKEVKDLLNVEMFLKNNSFGEKDRLWVCEKCKFKLAVVDVEKKEVRVRHKDFFIWNKIGKNGKVKIICRGCSFLNELTENDINN